MPRGLSTKLHIFFAWQVSGQSRDQNMALYIICPTWHLVTFHYFLESVLLTSFWFYSCFCVYSFPELSLIVCFYLFIYLWRFKLRYVSAEGYKSITKLTCDVKIIEMHMNCVRKSHLKKLMWYEEVNIS